MTSASGAIASPWSGLGGVAGAPVPPLPHDQVPAADDFERGPVQRIVPASSASAFPWRGPTTDAATPPATPEQPAACSPRPEEESPVARKPGRREAATPTRKLRAKRADSPQFQIACVLLAAGESGLAREAIAAKLDAVSAKTLTGTLWNMKTAGRVEHATGGDTWHLTQAGRDWATGGANLDNQRAAAAEPQPPIGHKKRAGKALRLAASSGTPVVPGAQHLVAVRSFRCWVASDGTFALEKNGQHIELTLEETREMLRYLDCTADELLSHTRAAA